MMEITTIRDGMMDYADQHMMPKMDSKGQFMLGVGLGLMASKTEKVVAALAENELVRTLDIIQGRQVDYENLYNAAMAQMKRQGKLVWDVPLLGRMAFDEQDLRDLHQCIMQREGAVK